MWLALVLFCQGAIPCVTAQLHAQGPEQRAPVVGLALSGGGALGLAHIGVIQVLEAQGIDVHVVAGTSMGALLGGLYATGIDGDSLAVLAESFNTQGDLFLDQVPRSFLPPDQRLFDDRLLLTLPIRDGRVNLPGGALEGASVVRALERATWSAQAIDGFDELPRPFVALATDLRRGRIVALQDGGLAEAIRASVAVPGVFKPVERGTQLLVDGAVVRNLPAEDARRLGAEFLICSDVSPDLASRNYESVVEVLSTAISLESQRNLREQYDQCDVILRPTSPEFTAADFEQLEHWLEVGRTETEEKLADILGGLRSFEGRGTLSEFLQAQRSRQAPPLPDSVEIVDIRFVGLDDPRLEEPARRALGIRQGQRVDAAIVDDAVTSLQATELYEGISYRIVRSQGANPTDAGPWVLEVSLKAAQRDRLGLGVRFDSQYRASVLLSATFLNRLGYGSSTRVDVRLGEEQQMQLVHLGGRGVTSTAGLGFAAGYNSVPLRLAQAGSTVQEVDSKQLYATGMVMLAQRAGGLLALEIRGERAEEETQVGSFLITDDRTFVSGALVGWIDTYDRADFPRSGIYALGRTEWSTASLGADFRQHIVDLRAAIPVGPDWSIQMQGYAGLAKGPELPLNRQFFLGGVNTSQVLRQSHVPLFGLAVQERWGSVAQLAALSLQWELVPGWFVTGRLNAGRVTDEWDLDLSSWIGGWGASVGTATLLGPVQVTFTGRKEFNEVRVALSMGRAF